MLIIMIIRVRKKISPINLINHTIADKNSFAQFILTILGFSAGKYSKSQKSLDLSNVNRIS